MKKILILLIGLFLINLVSSASLWKDDPNNCPNSYQAQTCSGSDLVCGYDSGVTFCYDMSSLSAPDSDTTTNSNVDDGTYNGGYLVDCYAYDGSSPHCDNSASFWCDRNSSCYDVGRNTECIQNVFGRGDCDICRTNYFECDGSYTDVDGCEHLAGALCGSNTGTKVDDQCFSSSVANCTRRYDYLDCDGDDSDDNEITCNSGNGCEINPYTTTNNSHSHYVTCTTFECDSGYCDCENFPGGTGLDANGCENQTGASCVISGADGTWNCDTCSCIPGKSYFETGTFTQYLIDAVDGAMLWFQNLGSGDLINATNVDGESFRVDNQTNIITEGNLTMGNKILFTLGEYIENIVAGWLKITGSLQITKDLNVTGSIIGENLTTRSNYICNETVCFTLQDLNTTSASGGTDSWVGNYTFYYNKSQIDNNFSLYYTKIETDNNLSLYLLLTDQTYNETDLINSINTTTNIMGLGFYNKSEIDANFSLYYTKSETDNNLSNYILNSSESDLNVNSSLSLNTSIGYIKDVNDTQFNIADYILSIDFSWLTSLFYQKSEVYNTTETYNKSEVYNKTEVDDMNFLNSTNFTTIQVENITGEDGGYIRFTNKKIIYVAK